MQQRYLNGKRTGNNNGQLCLEASFLSPTSRLTIAKLALKRAMRSEDRYEFPVAHNMIDLLLPPSVDAVIADFEMRSAPFTCMDVQAALSLARQSLTAPTMEEDRGSWAELLAFSLAGNEHGEKPWGTYFGPMGSGTAHDGTIVYFPDATEADGSILKHWKSRAGSCQAPVLVARYSDLIWDMSKLIAGEKRDQNFARMATSAYLSEAVQPGREANSAFPAAERAMVLALQIGDLTQRDAARKILLDLHRDAVASGLMWWRAPSFFEAQPKSGLDEQEQQGIISDLETILIRASDTASPSSFNPHDAESAAKMLEQLYRRQGDTARIPELHHAVARAFEHMGAMSEPMLAGMVLQTSADAYRQAGLTSDAERVQRLVEASNLAAGNEMKSHEFTMEVSKDEIEAVLGQLVQGTKEETFNRLAVEFMLRRGLLEEFLAQSAKDFPLSTIIPQSMMQGDRVVAQIGSLEDDPDGHIIAQGSRHLTLNNAWLKWAVDRARQNFLWTRDEVAGWANRAGMFGDGILLGEGVAAWLDDDHVKAVHVLVPQIETAFRKMAGALGRPTTEPHPQMRRARIAKPFGKMLGDIETASALGTHGPDLILHLRTLYSDPRGHNLRNDLAHGLLPSSSINATTSLLVVHSLLLIGAWFAPKTSGQDSGAEP